MLESQLQTGADQAKGHIHIWGIIITYTKWILGYCKKQLSHEKAEIACHSLPLTGSANSLSMHPCEKQPQLSLSSPPSAVLADSLGKYLFSWISQAEFTQPELSPLHISSETQHFPQFDSKICIQSLHLNSAHSYCCLQPTREIPSIFILSPYITLSY